MIADTASDWTWVQSEECKAVVCDKKNDKGECIRTTNTACAPVPTHDPKKSKTYKDIGRNKRQKLQYAAG